MKKRYFMSLLMGTLAFGAMAQTQYTILQDLTSKIQNADFKADTPVEGTVTTYDYNHTEVAQGEYCLFGQQAVTGWTSSFPSDNIKQMNNDKDPARTDGANARAAGIFAYNETTDENTPGLGGTYYAPTPDEGDTQALGLVAVWGADISYTQPITLPAGGYMLIQKYYNVSGDAQPITSNFGFIADGGKRYVSANVVYPADAEWHTDTAFIRVKAETTGVLSLGYKSGNWGSGSAPHLFIDHVEFYAIDPAPLDKAEADEAKVELLALIEEGEELGVDVSDAQAVYNNPNATVEQVQAAIASQKAINEAGTTDLSEFFITNPHFTLDTPLPEDNGITTYDYDMPDPNGSNGRVVDYFGMQPVTGWVASHPSDNTNVSGTSATNRSDGLNARSSGVFAVGSNSFLGGGAFLPPTTMSDGSDSGKLLGFVGVWSSTSQYTQHVTIPAGKYTLTISYYNAGGTSEIGKNLMGFIASDGTEYLSDVKQFSVGKWQTMTVKFELFEETEGDFTMGYTAANAGSAAMPHFFIDGISLVYAGKLDIDPSLLALQSTIGSALAYTDEIFNADLRDRFQEAIEDGSKLVSSKSSDAEANKAASDRISTMIADVTASIAAYKKLDNFYNTDLNNAQQKYTNLPDLHDQLVDMDDEVSEALNDCTWDNAKIDEVIASLKTLIKAEVQKAWDAALASGERLAEDLDISPLFDTLGVTYSTATAQGTNVPDKQWNYGSASNFKTQYGTAEVWNQSPFTVSQTLENMPAGKYTITTRAFYRIADQISNYDSYVAGDPMPSVAVFAGHAKSQILNVAEIASPDEAAFVDKSAVNGETLYVPNSQRAAHDVFESADYAERVSVSATTALATTGNLTFGITSEQLNDNSWVIWYTFEIAYNAVDDNSIMNELQATIDEAQAMLDNSAEVNFVNDTRTSMEDAIAAGESAIENGATDVMTAAIKGLNEALDKANKSVELIAKVNAAVTDYSNRLSDFDFESTDTELTSIIEKAEEGFESNEEIQQCIDALPAALVHYVLGRPDFNDGAEDNPIDITGVILNPAFDSANANYWSIVAVEEGGKVGQNQGYQSNNTYTNDEEGIIVSQFIEAWRPSGAALSDGDIRQTINAALPQGYYTLEVDGFATNQTEIPEGGIQGASLFAEIGGNVVAESMAIDVTGGVPQHFTLSFYSDGESLTSVGLRVAGTNASWIVADNFTLSYIGKTAPVAVNDIREAVTTAATTYTLSGVRVAAPRKGLNIIVRDGKATKVIVK